MISFSEKFKKYIHHSSLIRNQKSLSFQYVLDSRYDRFVIVCFRINTVHIQTKVREVIRVKWQIE